MLEQLVLPVMPSVGKEMVASLMTSTLHLKVLLVTEKLAHDVTEQAIFSSLYPFVIT